MTRDSWTQPCCAECWGPWLSGQGRDHMDPTRVTGVGVDECVLCGKLTTEGIYIRISPVLRTRADALRELMDVINDLVEGEE